MPTPNLYVKRLFSDVKLPTKATEFSAGYDVRAYITTPNQKITVLPNETKLIPTGLIMRPDEDYCIKVFPRSGLALKHNITLGNCVGLGDADYGLDTCIHYKYSVYHFNCPGFKHISNKTPLAQQTCPECIFFKSGPAYGVIIHNHGTKQYNISHQERICQIKVEQVENTNIIEVNILPPLRKASTRSGGFGHSGKQ